MRVFITNLGNGEFKILGLLTSIQPPSGVKTGLPIPVLKNETSENVPTSLLLIFKPKRLTAVFY